MKRADCIDELAQLAGPTDLVVCNLGRTGYEWRDAFPSDGNFYSMGMGLVTPLATGLGFALRHRRVIALDGDGSLLLDLGALATLGNRSDEVDVKVVVFDNEGYVSTGPQVTATAGKTDLAAVAKACGFEFAETVTTLSSFKESATNLFDGSGSGVLVAKVDPEMGSSPPSTVSGRENKYAFVRHIEQQESRRILRPSQAQAFVEHGSDATVPSIDVTPSDPIEALKIGIQRAGIDFVASLPSKELSLIQEWCSESDDIVHVTTASESEAAAVCAGAWLGGMNPAMIVASNGLAVATYALLRCHRTFEIPLLMISTFRGDLGETEWYGAHIGPSIRPLLASLGVETAVANTQDDLVRLPAMMRATMDASLGLFCLLLSAELTSGYRKTRPRSNG